MDKQVTEEMIDDVAKSSFHATDECRASMCEDCKLGTV